MAQALAPPLSLAARLMLDDVPDATYTGGPDFDRYFGTSGNDVIYGGGSSDILRGRDGDDWIFGGENSGTSVEFLYGDDGHDIIFGGKGRDQIFDGSGDDTVYGDSGDDTLVAGVGGRDTFVGGTGNDTLLYDFRFEAETASLTVDLSKNSVRGGGHDDVVRGFESLVFGGDQGHSIKGSKHAETLITGAGNDFIRGYTGSDTIETGAGRDTLYWERKDTDGVDTILDFELGQDTLDLGGLIKNTPFDSIDDVVRFENASLYNEAVGDTVSGTLMSVFAGKDYGWVDVALLGGLEDVTVASFGGDGLALGLTF